MADLGDGAREGHAPAGDDADVVGDAQGLGDVLLDEDDPDAVVVGGLTQGVHQAGDHDRGEPERHLVHEQHLGVAREGAAEAEHLLLPAREQAHLALEQGAKLGEELERPLDVAAPDAQVLGHAGSLLSRPSRHAPV